jgi:DNA-directed RNA polymerase specialized sigma24 family protein
VSAVVRDYRTRFDEILERHWGGLRFEQIAEGIGCSASTAFRRYTAGVEDLRTRLGG